MKPTGIASAGNDNTRSIQDIKNEAGVTDVVEELMNVIYKDTGLYAFLLDDALNWK